MNNKYSKPSLGPTRNIRVREFLSLLILGDHTGEKWLLSDFQKQMRTVITSKQNITRDKQGFIKQFMATRKSKKEKQSQRSDKYGLEKQRMLIWGSEGLRRHD